LSTFGSSYLTGNTKVIQKPEYAGKAKANNFLNHSLPELPELPESLKERKTMKRTLFETIVLVALVAFIVCLVSGSAWAVPSLINYQGKLVNASDCVLTGDYEIQFLLYETETDGTVLWGEQQTVSVDQGLLEVQLGRGVSFPSGLFDRDNLYLEMVIWSPETSSWETYLPGRGLPLWLTL
jgi:hypothetical protein